MVFTQTFLTQINLTRMTTISRKKLFPTILAFQTAQTAISVLFALILNHFGLQARSYKSVFFVFYFNSLAVLRSQSFHSGVGQLNSLQLRQQFSEDSFDKNRWAMVSTEPSDEEDEFGDVGI